MSELAKMPANSSRFNLNLWVLAFFLGLGGSATAELPRLTTDQQVWLGEQIYANECNRQASCLTSWNSGENFPSLGIGHFIWYRNGQTEPFTESFPQLLEYYRQQAVALPAWLDVLPGSDSPWPDRDSFYAEYDGPELIELRDFLLSTTAVQVNFIMARLERSLPGILEMSPADRRNELESLFYLIANSSPPYGMYALVDYVNFKGEGSSPSEQYLGQGWGLRQVLEEMLRASATARPLLEQFSMAAAAVLETRVANAPPERNESRWLEGWRKRVASYIPPA